MNAESPDLTLLLNRGAAGDRDAAERAFEHIYARLKAMAGMPGGARIGDTLHPTALVHEAFARLFLGNGGAWNDRKHFFSVAAKAMRHIVVDHARAKLAQKRGGGWNRVDAQTLAQGQELDPITLLMLEDALTELAELSPRQARIVELRFFAGLSVAQVALVIDKSERTVELDWRTARAWLQARLGTPGE